MLARLVRKSGAFTLTEVVVAIFLLTIVWLAAVNIIIISRASGALERHKVQAGYILQQTIENLRKQPYSTLTSYSSTVTIDTKGTPDTSAGDITGLQNVTVSPTTDPYYRKVLVKITWSETFFGKLKSNITEYCGTFIANDSQVN